MEAPKKALKVVRAEKRKERSKLAARCRRGRESEIFSDLCNTLPMSDSAKTSLDKASVMRLAVCRLKLRQVFDGTESRVPVPTIPEFESSESVNQALGGFTLILGLDGDMVYASDGILTTLGLSKYDIMGSSIFSNTHHYDHADIRSLLKTKNTEKTGITTSVFRMKCTLKGRHGHIRSENYKAISCTGRIVGEFFVATATPIMHPLEETLSPHTYFSVHSKDMKFKEVDKTFAAVLGYQESDLLGESFFQFCHACDDQQVSKTFKSLPEKGQGQMECYRLLAKGGGWVWMSTQVTVVKESVICLHQAITGRVEENQILSAVQIGEPHSQPKPTILGKRKVEEIEKENDYLSDLLSEPFPHPIISSKPVPSTEKIFSSKKAGMETEFLMQDLTHLAPMANDCVELDDFPLLDDFLESLEESGEEYSLMDHDEVPELLEPPCKMAKPSSDLVVPEKMPRYVFVPVPQTEIPMAGSDQRRSSGFLLSDRLLSSFSELTKEDCDMNAPIQSNSDLLQGTDFFGALEQQIFNRIPAQ